MARDGSGNFSVPYPNFVAGAVISDSEMDSNFSDVATALTQSIARDGQTTPTANLPMAGYKHTGVAASSSATDYARVAELQKRSHDWPTVGGTADVITLTFSPPTTAYTTGQKIRFKASGANTTTVTVNCDSIGAKALKSAAAGALSAGDIGSGSIVEATYDGTDFLMTKAPASALDISGLTAETAPATGDLVPLYDASATANRKMTLANVLNVTTSLTGLTAPAVDDELLIYDLSATAAKKITTVDLLETLNVLTEDTTPDTANDFILSYDTSASTVKKVKPSNLATSYDPDGTATAPYKIELPINSAASTILIQAGRGTTDGGGDLTVTFAQAYGAAPEVFATARTANGAESPVYTSIEAGSNALTSAIIHTWDSGGSAEASIAVSWFAIGVKA